MHGTRAVQVVLGEGEPGVLRLILEAQGFDVVGHARDDGELRTILDLTDPTVVVLDAGISVLAAADTRTRAPRAPIVVVWPKDTYTPLAEERVEPATVILELGNAVRRAAEHHLSPAAGPDDVVILEPELERPVVVPEAPARPRRRRRALVGVAAWAVALTASAAIAGALPSLLDDGTTVHPSAVGRPLLAFTQDREGTTVTAARSDDGTCEARSRGRGRGNGTANGHDVATGSGRACPDHGRDGGGKGGNGRGHGRPDDPGKGSGRGQGSSSSDRPVNGSSDEGSGRSHGSDGSDGSGGSDGSDGSGPHGSDDTDAEGDDGKDGGPPEGGPSKGSSGDRAAGSDHEGPGGGPAGGGAEG